MPGRAPCHTEYWELSIVSISRCCYQELSTNGMYCKSKYESLSGEELRKGHVRPTYVAASVSGKGDIFLLQLSLQQGQYMTLNRTIPKKNEKNMFCGTILQFMIQRTTYPSQPKLYHQKTKWPPLLKSASSLFISDNRF